MVVYEDGSAEAIKIYDRGVDYKDPETFGEYQLSYRSGDILSPRLSTEEPLALQVDDFLRAIRGTGRPDLDLGLALDVVRLAEAAHASLARGGERVALGEGHADVAGRVMGVLGTPVGVAGGDGLLVEYGPQPARPRHVSRDSALRRLLAVGDAVRRACSPWPWRW